MKTSLEWAFLAAILMVLPGALAQNEPATPPAPEGALACRALEVKAAEQMGVTLVVFHQASKTDGPRLGELLRANDGVSVEFETSDGHSHKATLFRLGTCFGRGLLVFRSESAHLDNQEVFYIRFPAARSR